MLSYGGSAWRVPPGVSFGWVNSVGGGGGGQGDTNTNGGGSGAGSGEFCLGMPIQLVPGSLMALGPGIGSTGGTSSGSSTQAGATTFSGFSVLAGESVANFNGTNFSGVGGGPRGGATASTPSSDGLPGSQESPTAFGGASGGAGEGLAVSNGGAGGQQIGQYSTPQVVNTGQHPSGGGGNGVFGKGGRGSTLGSGNSGTGYGAAGSGVANNGGTAGSGSPGMVAIFYMAP